MTTQARPVGDVVIDAHQPVKEIREDEGPGRPGPAGAAWRGVRIPLAQRRREDHHAATFADYVDEMRREGRTILLISPLGVLGQVGWRGPDLVA
jgi:hypothetical protein